MCHLFVAFYAQHVEVYLLTSHIWFMVLFGSRPLIALRLPAKVNKPATFKSILRGSKDFRDLSSQHHLLPTLCSNSVAVSQTNNRR